MRLSGPGFLVTAVMAGNFVNFLFNAILGRTLSLEQFSLITLASTLWFFITIFINSLSSATTNRTAYLSAKKGAAIALGFRSFMAKKSIKLALILVIIWSLLIPVFSKVFHSSDYLLFLSITPAILFGVFSAIVSGYFIGTEIFKNSALILLSESASKLLITFIFIALGLFNHVYLAIPLSVFCAFCTAYYLISKQKGNKNVIYNYIFPRKLLTATFFTIFSSVVFLSVDVLLARHFLSTKDSGSYALLSLVGKMVFLLGSLLNVFILTSASRDTGLKKNTSINFYKILGGTSLLTFFAFISLGIFGGILVPLLFGAKTSTITRFLLPYTAGIAAFTIANALATYHLAKQQYIFAANGILSTLIAVIGILIMHKSLNNFVLVIVFASFVYLGINTICHFLSKLIENFIQNRSIQKIHRVRDGANSPLSVSICVPAYNEEKNIAHILEALLKQKTKHITINKIVVISSGSTDKTDDIVNIFKQSYKKVHLIREEVRRGKASAINKFLKLADDPVVVVESADTIPHSWTIERLCRPFLINPEIGLTGGAPIPVNDENTFTGYLVHTWWWFHRNIPRFGEIIAFRNILPGISNKTAVDEAFIQAKMIQMGLKAVHVDNAIIRNKGPLTVRDLIKQRRRIFNGHSRLQAKEGVRIDNMSRSSIKLLFIYKPRSIKHFFWLIGGIGIEVYARMLGLYDQKFKKVNPFVWETARTTKNVTKPQNNVNNRHAI